jgi:hypothetical protein
MTTECGASLDEVSRTPLLPASLIPPNDQTSRNCIVRYILRQVEPQIGASMAARDKVRLGKPHHSGKARIYQRVTRTRRIRILDFI